MDGTPWEVPVPRKVILMFDIFVKILFVFRFSTAIVANLLVIRVFLHYSPPKAVTLFFDRRLRKKT